MKEFEDLFRIVKKLKHEYKKQEDFNVYDAIGFNTQEVMHSKFIAFLLNPRGVHKAGSRFLNLFLSQIGLQGFKIDNAFVSTEKRAGKRRIDIVIENDDSILIIENKIWHNDSPCQLEDYYKYCKKSKANVEVMYLTPYGHRPSAESLGETLKIEDVKCISYEKEIFSWIVECSKQTEGSIKYSLEMYIELLQTVINRSRYMNAIFEELKKDKEKLKLAININSALQGRNYFIEFPNIKETLFDIILNDIDEINAYPEDSYLSIEFPEKPEKVWSIMFDVGNAYIQDYNDDDSKIHYIDLFYYHDLSNKLLQNLIIEDKEIVWQIITEKFEEIRQFCKSK